MTRLIYLQSPVNKKTIIRDLILLANSDDDYDSSEISLVNEAADKFQIPKESRYKIVAWVANYRELMKKRVIFMEN